MREFLFSFLARHLSTVTTEFFPLLPPCRVDPKASCTVFFCPPPLNSKLWIDFSVCEICIIVEKYHFIFPEN